MSLNHILLTGASGFLGQHLLSALKDYEVKTLGRRAECDYCIDLSDQKFTIETSFDLVIHAAGKAHSTPVTEKEVQCFFDVNLEGTKNLCATLEQVGLPQSFIFISTVAVYGMEKGENITEDMPLKGNTPYALSKIQTESFLQEWCDKHKVVLGIIRPSLIAGKNPPGNLGSMIEGIQSGRYLSIAGGKARKSVVMAEDIARIIPVLAEKGGIYNLCDNHHPSFRELEILMTTQLKKSLPFNIPFWIAKGLAIVGDRLGNRATINSAKLDKIVNPLTFSNLKARQELGWEPLDVLTHFKIK